MTPEEFHQLKAFARQDGALLSVLWIGSFACYILGIANPLLGTLALLLILVSPIFAANRLRHFRDGAREGVISFRRGYAYTALVFFYAAVLLAAAIYIYFAFIDNGYLLSTVNQFLMTKEGKQLIELRDASHRLCRQHAVSQYHHWSVVGTAHRRCDAEEVES